ncbi:transglutaminase-like domain-containing protein [Desulfomonile tiedjei]|uniref:Transglutaminase-like enzyme, predicted cysteine protease n=1 Tax=Desulfomonile tiedjei (strain ATCC 49306 / DSM 6799 / DCB-1) TaxID=706587 RepID=I4CCF8_DESTA|nr:transglutaminase-like domain-containing protein [Desulfomonile tiedjei]AFM27249.1 transglutaminase-like enzyme, predicted cysteine protease [Desulfomonile tiedjei DSM 6799]
MPFFSMRPSNRFNPYVTGIIVACWLILVGYLVKDQFLEASATVSDSFRFSTVETDDWFIIRIAGAFGGFGRSRQFKGDSGWRIRDDLNISLNLQGQVKPVRISNEAEVDQDFRLISFRLRVSSGIVSFDQKGYMSGRDLIIDIPKFQGGGTKKIKLAEVPRMSRSLGLPVPLTGLQVGDDIRLPIFDPLDGNKWDAAIKVLEKADVEIGDKKIPAWRVRATFRSVEVIMWIDDQGRLLKGRMPLNIMVVRSDKNEIQRELRASRDLPDLVAMTSVPLEGTIPEPDKLQRIKLQIQGITGVALPSDSRQKISGTEIELTRQDLPVSSYALPNKDPRMGRYLMPSRFIRSDSPEIIRKAQEIVGNETDPVKAALLVNSWVFKNLKKVPTPAVPDAFSVLQMGQGDCNEHAVLAASFARAIGLPAQIAVGLIYSEGGFFYHAWVEYWTGSSWLAADPLMDKAPIPPLYIALLHGDVDKHVNVMAFLGELKLKVLDITVMPGKEVSLSR